MRSHFVPREGPTVRIRTASLRDRCGGQMTRQDGSQASWKPADIDPLDLANRLKYWDPNASVLLLLDGQLLIELVGRTEQLEVSVLDRATVSIEGTEITLDVLADGRRWRMHARY